MNTAENFNNYITSAFSNEKIEQELNNPNSEFYFAVHQDQVIGYLKVNFNDAQTEGMGEEIMEIERIYITKQFHGNGFGKQLIDKSKEVARSRERGQFREWLQ